MSRDALARVTEFWEHITPERVAAIGSVYTPDAYFRDPFNEVRGEAELRRIFNHMFETLAQPRFRIRESLLEGAAAMLVWDFDFRMKSLKPELDRRIHGASHLRFAADGRVEYHRDYWDAAGELYAQLPVIGPQVRWLAKKLGQ